MLNPNKGGYIRIGTISDVDNTKALARVAFGDIKSYWIPWLTPFSGKNKVSIPIEIGEQVIVLCENGHIDNGVIVRGLHHHNSRHTEGVYKIQFEDGSFVEHCNGSHTTLYSSGILSLKSTSDLSMTADTIRIEADTIHIESPSINIKGNVNCDGIIKADKLIEKKLRNSRI